MTLCNWLSGALWVISSKKAASLYMKSNVIVLAKTMSQNDIYVNEISLYYGKMFEVKIENVDKYSISGSVSIHIALKWQTANL